MASGIGIAKRDCRSLNFDTLNSFGDRVTKRTRMNTSSKHAHTRILSLPSDVISKWGIFCAAKTCPYQQARDQPQQCNSWCKLICQAFRPLRDFWKHWICKVPQETNCDIWMEKWCKMHTCLMYSIDANYELLSLPLSGGGPPKM